MVKLGPWLSEGWNVFSKNMGTLVLAVLLVALGSLLSLTILAGPLSFGLYYMTLHAMRGEPVQIGDLGFGFQRFGKAFLWWLVLIGIAIVFYLLERMGTAANIIFTLLNFLIQPWLTMIFGLAGFQIVQADVDLGKAFSNALEIIKKDLLKFWVCGLVFAILQSIGIVACCVGILFTASWITCALAVAYRDLYLPSGTVTVEASAPPAG